MQANVAFEMSKLVKVFNIILDCVKCQYVSF